MNLAQGRKGGRRIYPVLGVGGKKEEKKNLPAGKTSVKKKTLESSTEPGVNQSRGILNRGMR